MVSALGSGSNGSSLALVLVRDLHWVVFWGKTLLSSSAPSKCMNGHRQNGCSMKEGHPCNTHSIQREPAIPLLVSCSGTGDERRDDGLGSHADFTTDIFVINGA